MPNWCTNKLVISGPDVPRILKEITDERENWPFSFEKVIPAPAVVNMKKGDHIDLAKAAALWKRGDITQANTLLGLPDHEYDNALVKIVAQSSAYRIRDFYPAREKDDAAMDFDLMAAAGEVILNSNAKVGDWYRWRLKNWGVKWNLDKEVFVKQVSHESAVLLFLTANTAPLGVFAALATKCPDHNFYLGYHEPSADFSGQMLAIQGELMENMECPYSEKLDTQDNRISVPRKAKWRRSKNAVQQAASNKAKTESFQDVGKQLDLAVQIFDSFN
jgi:hypothetical protein